MVALFNPGIPSTILFSSHSAASLAGVLNVSFFKQLFIFDYIQCACYASEIFLSRYFRKEVIKRISLVFVSANSSNFSLNSLPNTLKRSLFQPLNSKVQFPCHHVGVMVCANFNKKLLIARLCSAFEP